MPKDLARLVLPKPVMRRLDASGVYCQTWVTAEKQARSDRWVLRGVESGGSTREIGRYISFFAEDGGRIAWLQKLDRIGPNGVHAVVVATELMSIEMARIGQTYQLLAARHRLEKHVPSERPRVESTVIFRGIDGQLSPELLEQKLAPEFFSRGGEVKPIPESLAEAVKAVTAGVSCVNCRHCHGLIERAVSVALPVTVQIRDEGIGDKPEADEDRLGEGVPIAS